MSEAMEEGIIKFNCTWTKKTVVFPGQVVKDILEWRSLLYKLDFVGADKNGTGFGNLSARQDGEKIFYITGSSTGNIRMLKEKHLARVDRFHFYQNHVVCTGLVRASAETLTHAAIYESDPEVNGVIHVHSNRLWKFLRNKVPTTAGNAGYGTSEMVFEIMRLFRDTETRKQKIIIMAGHKDGIITFGKDLKEAGSVLLAYINLVAL